MAAPTFGLAGTAAGSSTVATPAYPATVNADDIAILIVETSNEPISAAAIGDGSWTQFASVGTGTAAAVDSVALQGFWRRCDGSEASTTVSLPDSGNHTLGRIYTIAGCVTSGDPIHAVNTSFNNTASTAFSVAGFTTTVSDCLVMCAMGRGNDASGVTAFSGFTNADLTSVSEPASTEAGTTLGTGGGFGIGIGTKATAGTVGNFTATCTGTAKQANIQFALKSTTSSGGTTSYTLTADPGSFGYTGQAANLTVGRVMAAAAGSFGYTGQAANLNASYLMAAATGTFSYTGQAATLSPGKILTAAVGTFGYTGQAALLTAALSLLASAGSFGYTGQPANMTISQVMGAATGSFGYVGQAANLTAASNITMAAATGTFGYTGQAALLLASGPTLIAATGTFGYTGQAARATLNLSSFPSSSGGGSGGPKVSAMFYR